MSRNSCCAEQCAHNAIGIHTLLTAAWGEDHVILRLSCGPGHCVCRWSFNATQLSLPPIYSRAFSFDNGCETASIFADCAPDGRLSFQTCMGRTESAILGGTLQKFWKLKETHTYTFTVSKTHMRACVRAFMLSLHFDYGCFAVFFS